MNALIFLYKRVLKQDLTGEIDAVRSVKKNKVPVVLSREEVAAVISIMEGVPRLVTQLLYDSGLRISEALRLRVQDIDFSYEQITVRSGKGQRKELQRFRNRWNRCSKTISTGSRPSILRISRLDKVRYICRTRWPGNILMHRMNGVAICFSSKKYLS